MMKNAIIIVTIFLCLVNTAGAKEKIRITNGEWAPYLSEHLPKNGLASDIVRAAFAAVGIDVTYGFFPWKRSFKLAREGKWNGSVVWVHTPERARDFLYSDTVISDHEYLFHLKDLKLKWKTVEDLKGLKIGGTLHTVYPVFESAEGRGILSIEQTGTYENLYRRLLKKRIDAIPQVSAVGEYLIRTTLTESEQSKITVSPTIIQTREYALILSKNVPENASLLQRFNRGLSMLRDSGEYQKMLDALKNGEYDPAILGGE